MCKGLALGIKRIADILISLLALLALWPILLLIAVAIWLDTGGPIIYKQQRIGQDKRPFQIYKFCTMCPDAEAAGPQLSNPYDKRVTHVGLYLRRYRLDELPQFVNILRGDMSLVGPRPEREYFIEQIAQHNSDFPRLLQMRPGLTSWGQVKYGYASSVEQICERMQYDLYYTEHFSLLFDLKILLHTVRIVLSGKGV